MSHKFLGGFPNGKRSPLNHGLQEVKGRGGGGRLVGSVMRKDDSAVSRIEKERRAQYKKTTSSHRQAPGSPPDDEREIWGNKPYKKHDDWEKRGRK